MAEYDALADLYDLEYGHEDDVPFWLALASREEGPVVEWGAGTGRVSVPLARRGFDVAAVEISRPMVEAGKEKGANLLWVRADARDAKLEARYRLAICAFNSFLCFLDPEDALRFLRNVREHLRPGGLFGIEVSVFSPEELAEPSGTNLRHDFTRRFPEGALDRFSATRYDPASQVMEMRLFYELYDAAGRMKSRRAHDLRIRLTNRAELELMLRAAGFGVEAVYGGFDGETFTSESERLVVLARR